MDVPQKYRGIYQEAMTGRRPQRAIRTFCLMCVGWQRIEVDKCTAPSCPLYPYREWAKGHGQPSMADQEPLGPADGDSD